MSLPTRIHLLERRATGGQGQKCRCKGPMRVLYENDWMAPGDPAHDSGSAICPRCHRERMTYRITYLENWRGEERAQGGTS